MPRPTPLPLFLLLLLLGVLLAWGIHAQAACTGPTPLSGASPPIGLVGQVEGTPGAPYDWIIHNNTYSIIWQNASTAFVEAGWILEGQTGPDCSNPYLYNYNYVKYYSWSVDQNSWTTTYNGFPAFQTTIYLPNTQDPLVFYWIVHTDDGSHFIYYVGNLTNTDPAEQTNSLLGSILNEIRNIISNIINWIIDALQQFFSWLWNHVKSLLPSWLVTIIETSWQIIGGFAPPLFNLVVDIFQVYPFLFMMISLKYILTGDIEGWLNYIWLHVEIVRKFIDLGFKLIEAVTP